MSETRRTAPVSVAVGALASVQNAIFPAVAIALSGIGGAGSLLVALGVGLASAAIGTLVSYIGWRRLTYTVGEQDIRVESGVLSRSARSVPYERIQDVSLEAKLLPRLFGLVSVKFETGAGGEDLALQYLTSAEGERLRRLVRERREEEEAANAGSLARGEPSPEVRESEGEVLFAMSPRRLLTFGLFEFSLAVFAVLGGLLQYVDTFTEIDVWNVELWEAWLAEQGSFVASIGPYAQAAGVLAGLFGLVLIGLATGIARTFAREWGFVLERSARGFRRRRGLFTRTDVVMPAHRVQGLVIETGIVRHRFGWRSLSFVSLAQDTEGESHVVAPFARDEEIAPIVTAAGFRLPDARTEWHRASKRYRTDRMLDMLLACLVVALALAIFAPFGFAFIPLGLAVMAVGINLYAWEFQRHALDETQVYATTGWLSPTSRIATRLKLHSVEIRQGPLARLRGYATVHLGLAGGEFAIPGVPLARARELRAAVVETIAGTDFSRLHGARERTPVPEAVGNQAFSEDQSGLSANLRAT